jgi:hypothetical protein
MRMLKSSNGKGYVDLFLNDVYGLNRVIYAIMKILDDQ